MMILYLLVLLLVLLSICNSFHINRCIRSKSSLSMKFDAMRDVFGLVPICDANLFSSAPPSISIADDPTAGMSADEITNYMSNVGGGLCGLPEFVRTGVGLGLNISLLSFGVLTILYVLLGGTNYLLENQLNDAIKDYEKVTGSRVWSNLNADTNKQNTFSPEGYVPSDEAKALAPDRFNSKSTDTMGNEEPVGLNRKEKRLKAQLQKDVGKEKDKRSLS